MNKFVFTSCLSLMVPFAMNAVAQTVAPDSAPVVSNYSLDSGSLKGATSSVQQVTAMPYELSGTNISGSTGADEQTILTAPVPGAAAPFKLENGVYLYPTVYVGFGYNDNVTLVPAGEIGSNFTNVAPQLLAEMKNKGDRYTLLASVNRTIYSNSSPDNATASNLQLAGDNFFDARARMGWAVAMVDGFDPRSPTSVNPNEPDKWSASTANGKFIYGAPEAMGRAEVDLGYQKKTYDNIPTKDVNTTSVAGRAYYRLGTRSLALAEIRNAQASYVSPLSIESNTERRYYAGLTWDATAATTGILKIGTLHKDFVSAQRSGFSGGSWEAALRWLPLTYSAFDLQTSKSTADTTGVGDYTINTSTNLTWSHTWSDSLLTTASVGTVKSDFVNGARADETSTYSLGVNYAFRRWLTLGVSFTNTDNASTDPLSVYKRNVTMFSLNASL